MSKHLMLSVQLRDLLEKMRSYDSDLRLMALIDLNKDLIHLTSSPAATPSKKEREDKSYTDESTEVALTDMVLKMIVDSNAEVKNMAVTCLGAMTRKARSNCLNTIIDNLLNGVSSASEEQRDIACLALKTTVLDMSTEGNHVEANLETIIKKVYGIITQPDVNPQLASDLLQTLTDIYTRFSDHILKATFLRDLSLPPLILVLSTARPSIRKRAIPTLSALVNCSSPESFDTQLKATIVKGLQGDAESRRVWTGVVASLARGQNVHKIGGLVIEGQVMECILTQTQDVEDNEAVEGALVALEVLVSRCPLEVGRFITPIVSKAMELLKYDPNYAGDDSDEDMDGDDEDDDDFDDDAYSDDEDVSWKIRRSAAKLLFALIGSRNELILDFYRSLAPVLISRFNEREESVRLEVLAAFEVLLKQTVAAKAAELASGGRNKRKRSEEMDDENALDDTPVAYLQALLPNLLRAVLKQLSSKSDSTRQQSFNLLSQVVDALSGGLDAEADSICTSASSALRSGDSSSSGLTITALSFLAVFFAQHSPRVYAVHLDSLVPAICKCMRDKLQRVNFEAFNAASSLAQAIRPISKGSASPMASNFVSPIHSLLGSTTEVLADTSVDGDVRQKALETLGSLLFHEGDSLTQSYGTALPLITARLANENTAATAVLVIGKVAESSTCKGPVFDKWLIEVLPEVVVTLRKNKKSLSKTAEFHCLQHILDRIGSSLPQQIAEGIVIELKPFVDTPIALSIISQVLSQQPSIRNTIDAQILPSVFTNVKSSTKTSGLTDFFSTYTEGDPDCAIRLVQALVENLGKSKSIPDATRGGTGIYSTTSQCIGATVAKSKRNEAGIMALFLKMLNSGKGTEADVYFALLSIGEIGRNSDLSGHADLFPKVLSFFSNQSEEVRSAAAFAAGNLAVGAAKVFVPQILSQISSSPTESARLLLLHAVKEVILHSSPGQLEALSESLWNPLFSEEQTDIGDDGIRNVKAACVGKLTTTSPAKFLPRLQELLRSSPRNRAIVAAAVRYTFIDTSSLYDELIAPIVVDFLSLMHDENLIVRRLSLASLNAAIQNKPHLIKDSLTTLQPLLYQETVQKPELCREVKMGPWTVTVDDGLENRKTAYETMYTLLATCFSKIDLPTFTDRVMAALKDVNEIKVLGLMLLLRLGQLSPSSVIPRLDEVALALKATMQDLEVKDDTIKQDLERKEEMQRSTLRTAVPLYKMSTYSQAPGFHKFVHDMLSSEKWKDFKDYQA
ncbi:hypothetical protein P7C73_g6321, partial [Tremellales sp. Uapishka_1]